MRCVITTAIFLQLSKNTDSHKYYFNEPTKIPIVINIISINRSEIAIKWNRKVSLRLFLHMLAESADS